MNDQFTQLDSRNGVVTNVMNQFNSKSRFKENNSTHSALLNFTSQAMAYRLRQGRCLLKLEIHSIRYLWELVTTTKDDWFFHVFAPDI